MCLISMGPSHMLSMDRGKFLRTAIRKRTINKKKAEPDMRVEALLETTCKRLRQEMKLEQKRRREECDISSKRIKADQFSDEDSDSDSEVDVEEYDDCEEEEDEHPTMCTMFNKRTLNDTGSLSLAGNLGGCSPSSLPSTSSSSASSDLKLDRRLLSLWDDPQQVEDFFRQVDTDHDPEKTFDENLDLDKELFNPVQTCPDNLLATCVPACDLNSFTSEFDSLYREMFQKLSAVESIVNQQQNGHVITVLDGS